MANRVSDDEKYDILYFHKLGHTANYIAYSMDIKTSRVRYVIKRYNTPKPWYCKLLNFFGLTYE